jgi:hypothetical protein
MYTLTTRQINSSRYKCLDCGANVITTGNWYMAHPHVWDDLGLRKKSNMCIACLTKRAGRPLRCPDDIQPASAWVARPLKQPQASHSFARLLTQAFRPVYEASPQLQALFRPIWDMMNIVQEVAPDASPEVVTAAAKAALKAVKKARHAPARRKAKKTRAA